MVPTNIPANIPAGNPVLQVNPASDREGTGTVQFPFKTITQALKQALKQALRQAQPGVIIQLAAGTYQTETGEQFPLDIPSGVSVVGQGQVLIKGGGSLATADFGAQNVAVVLRDRAQLKGVTITNPVNQGTGLWVEAGTPLIIRNRFSQCRQNGVMVAGNARPLLLENEFVENLASGLYLVRYAKGEVRQNRFRRCGYGIALSDRAAPLLWANQVQQNRMGIVISRQASPVLRQNQVSENRELGLWVKDSALIDLGQSQDPGENRFQHNGPLDLRSEAATPIVTVGNLLSPTRARGRIAYLASEVADVSPTPLLGQVSPSPLPAPPRPVGPPDAGLDPGNLDSRFADLVGHWAAPFVEVLADRQLVRGFADGSFRPDQTVTRAEYAALMLAAFPQSATPNRRSSAAPFADVPPSFWAKAAIERMRSQGFMSGFPDGTFRPNAPMTRVQAVVALVQGLDLGEGRSDQLLVYRDRAQIPSYAVGAIAAATQRRLVVTYPDPAQLRPMQPITRAETAALIYQTLAALEQLPQLPSPFIVQPDRPPGFTDLARHWAEPFVQALVQKDWLSGFKDGSFQPETPITRAQFAALLVKTFEPEPQRPASPFRDVSADFWAAEPIQRAYQAGFMSGFPDLTFAPDHALVKLQVLLALVSGLKLATLAPVNLAVLDVYRDRAQIPSYARDALSIATQLGIVFNYPEVRELDPSRVAARGETAAMVYQALTLINRMPAIASPYRVSRALAEPEPS